MSSLRYSALVVAAVMFAARAHASPPLELLGSSFGSGGWNARAYGASAASAYFNPALLPQAAAGFETGTFVLNDVIDITLDPRAHTVDVPEAALDNFNNGARSMGTLPPEPTTWLEHGCKKAGGNCVSDLAARPRQAAGSSGNTHAYQAVGLVQHLWRRYLTLGFYTLVPLGSYVKSHAFFVDEREQYFDNSLHPELYSDRLTTLSFALGLGSQITRRISVGVGASLSLTNTAAAGTYIGDSSRLNDTLQLSTGVEVDAALSPHLGVRVEPLDGLALTATVHAPEKMQTDASNDSLLANGDHQIVRRTSVQAWQPWIFGLGAAYDFYHFDKHAWTAVASGTYQLWSSYLNRQGERPQHNYEWSNTPTLTVGVRYAYEKTLAAMLDGTFQPSPVPLQSGRTNYVDNDRYGVNTGATYNILLGDGGATLRLGCQAQMHLLQERHQSKVNPSSPKFAGRHYSQLVQDEWSDAAVDSRGQLISEAAGLQTNNPGWPGFSSSGLLIGAGVSASLLY